MIMMMIVFLLRLHRPCVQLRCFKSKLGSIKIRELVISIKVVPQPIRHLQFLHKLQVPTRPVGLEKKKLYGSEQPGFAILCIGVVYNRVQS